MKNMLNYQYQMKKYFNFVDYKVEVSLLESYVSFYFFKYLKLI